MGMRGKTQKEAIIINAVRTPVGKHHGKLSSVSPVELGALVVEALIKRTGIDFSQIEEVNLGCANQAGEDNRNLARWAALLAGKRLGVDHDTLVKVGAVTTNVLCGSGLEAVREASLKTKTGECGVIIAGGVENMSRAPLVTLRDEYATPEDQGKPRDTTLGPRFLHPELAQEFSLWERMGDTAENIRALTQESRKAQDRFAFLSHVLAHKATQKGKFKDEIIPVPIKDKEGKTVEIVERDETIRNPLTETSLEKLAALPPVFKEGGTVTAGNSSPISDGAAALLLTNADFAADRNLKPLARIIASALVGVDPSFMGYGPVGAVKKVLKLANLTLDQMDLVELNEAFAVQAIAVIKQLGLDPHKVNVNGGAIALGHPLGCSGARILTTLVHEMKRRDDVRYGLATLCIGGGQGIAMIVEKI